MLMLDDLPALIRRVESIRRKTDEARGELTQILKALKKEFGVVSLDEVRDLIETKTAKREKITDVYLKKVKKVKKHYPRLFKEKE